MWKQQSTQAATRFEYIPYEATLFLPWVEHPLVFPPIGQPNSQGGFHKCLHFSQWISSLGLLLFLRKPSVRRLPEEWIMHYMFAKWKFCCGMEKKLNIWKSKNYMILSYSSHCADALSSVARIRNCLIRVVALLELLLLLKRILNKSVVLSNTSSCSHLGKVEIH